MSSLHGHHFVVLIVSLMLHIRCLSNYKNRLFRIFGIMPSYPLSPCLTHILMQKLNKNVNCGINDHIQGQYYYLRWSCSWMNLGKQLWAKTPSIWFCQFVERTTFKVTICALAVDSCLLRSVASYCWGGPRRGLKLGELIS